MAVLFFFLGEAWPHSQNSLVLFISSWVRIAAIQSASICYEIPITVRSPPVFIPGMGYWEKGKPQIKLLPTSSKNGNKTDFQRTCIPDLTGKAGSNRKSRNQFPLLNQPFRHLPPLIHPRSHQQPRPQPLPHLKTLAKTFSTLNLNSSGERGSLFAAPRSKGLGCGDKGSKQTFLKEVVMIKKFRMPLNA